MRDINAHFTVFHRFFCVTTWRNVIGEKCDKQFSADDYFVKYASDLYHFLSMNASFVLLDERLVPWRSSFCWRVKLTLTIVYQQCAEWMGGEGRLWHCSLSGLLYSTISVVFPFFQESFTIFSCSSHPFLSIVKDGNWLRGLAQRKPRR